jgi:hypothetical protein
MILEFYGCKDSLFYYNSDRIFGVGIVAGIKKARITASFFG